MTDCIEVDSYKQVRCLTTWPHPSSTNKIIKVYYQGVSDVSLKPLLLI